MQNIARKQEHSSSSPESFGYGCSEAIPENTTAVCLQITNVRKGNVPVLEPYNTVEKSVIVYAVNQERWPVMGDSPVLAAM